FVENLEDYQHITVFRALKSLKCLKSSEPRSSFGVFGRFHFVGRQRGRTTTSSASARSPCRCMSPRAPRKPTLFRGAKGDIPRTAQIQSFHLNRSHRRGRQSILQAASPQARG